MWFLFAQRDERNPLHSLRPACDPVELPNPIATGDRFEAPVAGKQGQTKCIVIEVSQDAAALAEINRQLAQRGSHAVERIVIWAEEV